MDPPGDISPLMHLLSCPQIEADLQGHQLTASLKHNLTPKHSSRFAAAFLPPHGQTYLDDFSVRVSWPRDSTNILTWLGWTEGPCRGISFCYGLMDGAATPRESVPRVR